MNLFNRKQKFIPTFVLTPLLSAFFATSSVYAQSDDKSFQLGFLGSGNLGWVKNTQGPLVSDGLGLGFSYGLTGDFKLSKSKSNYFITVELFSTNLSVKASLDDTKILPTKGSQTYDDVSYRHKLNYIDIPISLKLKLNEIGYTTWFAQFGVTPSILGRAQTRMERTKLGAGNVKETIDGYYTNKKESEQYEYDNFRDDIRFYRFATFIGAGMEYRFSGNTALLASLRFNNGLTNIFADNKEPKGIGQNAFIGIYAGILF
jgi:hypothetical protein